MKQPAKQPKKNLADAMEERLKKLVDVRQQRIEAEKRSKFKKQEDEVMVMCYGPNWRETAPGEPVAPKRPVADEDDDYEDYDKAS